MISDAGAVSDRLARYRSALRSTGPADPPARWSPGPVELAERLARALDGEIIRTVDGTIVRRERPSRALPVDRHRLATLPGQPTPEVPLVCLDTETTGLATATGTVAFLIGLGWWEADRFRQVQLVLPDQGEERALLSALRETIPVDGWLVTYNGRAFDWPLMVTRYRMSGQPAPTHAGHLDLLPIVRRLFRHRMPDARLQTAETVLLGLPRHGDVGGWEIPGRYLDFLRGGPAANLVDVIDHNDLDVRSLAHLLAFLADGLGDPDRRPRSDAGDLAGLARVFARDRRLAEALDCLELACREPRSRAMPRDPRAVMGDAPWWSTDRPADFGGRPPTTRLHVAGGAPWTTERIAVDRAHLLRRLGRHADAAAAWAELAAGRGRVAIVAMIELAKLREHRLADRPGALAAALDGLAAADRRRRQGRPERDLEADLQRRIVRLKRRVGGRSGAQVQAGQAIQTAQHGIPVGHGRQPVALDDQ